MANEPAKIRLEIRYGGRVQGVGFRYSVVRIAERYPVTGFVENMSDGSVQLVAEGERLQLRHFTTAITDAMRRNIEHEDVTERTAMDEFSNFTIRR